MRRLQILVHLLWRSFWLLPAGLVVFAILSSWLVLYFDTHYTSGITHSFVGQFTGQADAARQLLGATAGSLITVISISFSITILALQQVATQYSPRVLRSFTADRANQIVLGSYLGTFIYTLLVLRAVRSGVDGSPSFVPALSITMGFIFTLLCVGLLIYFISHISGALQVENIVRRIHGELMEQLSDLFPEPIGEAAEDPGVADDLFVSLTAGREAIAVQCNTTGFLQAFDDVPLAHYDDEAVSAVFIKSQVGDFVVEGEPVMYLSASAIPDVAKTEQLLKALVVGQQRSIYQDPLFGIEQLVDIALRALSSGINDPATASDVLYQLTHALCRLANRRLPDVRRTFPDTQTIFVFSVPSWGQYLEAAYGQIRYAGRDQTRLLATLIQQLHRLIYFTPTAARKAPVTEQIMNVRQQLESSSLPEMDRQKLLRRADAALLAAGAVHPQQVSPPPVSKEPQ